MSLTNTERFALRRCITLLNSAITNPYSSDSSSVFDEVINVLESLSDSKPNCLTDHFNLDEFLASPTAVKNNLTLSPNQNIYNNLLNLCSKVLEPARLKIGGPIIVTSGYRSQALNRLVGGASNSYHLYGRAADIVAPFGKHNELYNILSALPHVELLDYNTFIHVAL
ncbi:MAG: D-Ala-D-Ala carboxypeptidase family metallohydrolase [Staphylococcus sp.]|nr:D-Ala-D-Ala carboxypeptidase family metallohydrolase [Staphylococcus sp.]